MQNITVQEYKARLDAAEEIHLLDVREPDEFAEYNLGGMLLPLGHILSMQTDDIEDWKEDEIIVYCRSGKRSMQAGMMLETMGFKNVKNLAGGVLAWREMMGI
ncbi:MAG: rhodanese-like domain-containing protein [Chitinophagaceae bacterium]